MFVLHVTRLPSWERWSLYSTGKCNAITWFIFQRSLPQLHGGQTFKTTIHNLFFFSGTIVGHGSCILVHYSRHIYNSKLENHLCLEFHLKNCKTERRNCVINNRSQLFRLSSLYTRATITTDSSARSRPLRFHLTTGSRRIPPHVMFFSDRICSICKLVISVNHSLAKMCFPLPRVHMCLHCGGRQKLWLTVVRNSILAANETTGRLHAHLSRLYR